VLFFFLALPVGLLLTGLQFALTVADLLDDLLSLNRRQLDEALPFLSEFGQLRIIGFFTPGVEAIEGAGKQIQKAVRVEFEVAWHFGQFPVIADQTEAVVAQLAMGQEVGEAPGHGAGLAQRNFVLAAVALVEEAVGNDALEGFQRLLQPARQFPVGTLLVTQQVDPIGPARAAPGRVLGSLEEATHAEFEPFRGNHIPRPQSGCGEQLPRHFMRYGRYLRFCFHRADHERQRAGNLEFAPAPALGNPLSPRMEELLLTKELEFWTAIFGQCLELLVEPFAGANDQVLAPGREPVRHRRRMLEPSAIAIAFVFALRPNVNQA